MEHHLYDLLAENQPPESLCWEENQRLSSNLGRLRKTLNQHQRRLLIRIIDDKDLITEKSVQDGYANGFRMATKIMIESLYL